MSTLKAVGAEPVDADPILPPQMVSFRSAATQLHGLHTLVAQLGVDGGTGGGINIFSKKKTTVRKGFKALFESRHAIYS